MARPRNKLFYETPLPDYLPPEKEWLRDYHRNSRNVVEYIARNGAKSTAYHAAIRALTLFREYLLQNRICFSPVAATQWCAGNAPLVKGYEITLSRLLDFYQYGSVQPIHAFPYAIQYCTQLSGYWLGLLNDFSLSLQDKAGDKNYQAFITNAAARFLYGIQISGIHDISQVTFSVLKEYCDRDQHRSHNSDARYTYIIGDFLHAMAKQGLCPFGLGWYPYFRMTDHILRFSDLSAEQQDRVESVRSESLEFPADEYACLIPGFLEELQSFGYSKSPMKSSRFTLYNLLLFLQMNGFGYHHVIADVWTDCARKKWQHTGWKQSKRTLFLFGLFLEQNAVIPQAVCRSKGLKYESLPAWCRLEIELFIEQKQKEGWEQSTVCMFRSSVTRFCEYLVSAGLVSFSELTAAAVKTFNQNDLHQTEEGKNAYNVRIRKFLAYLERKGIVPYGIHLSLYAKSAPKERIITVLGEQDETAIINAGKDAVSPLDLRDNAILLTGLRMGLRAGDVINMKLSDINWDRQSIRIIQDKTDREIEVPMPVEVGNAIYRYLKFGRHASDSPNVFIKDRAPYDSVQRGVCLRALYKTVPSQKGAGYHITRRTFATKRLRGNTGRQAIADLLGHSDTTSLHHYLHLDEKRMRMCPISMEDVGIMPEGRCLYD